MSPKEELHIILFADFLAELKLLGFQIGADTHIRIHQWMNYWAENRDNGEQLGNEEVLRRLKVQLRALVVQREDQQQVFNEAFDEFVRRYKPREKTEIEDPERVDSRKDHRLLIAIGFCVIAIIGLYASWGWANRGRISGEIVYDQQAYTHTIWVEDRTAVFQAPFFRDSLEKRYWEVQYRAIGQDNVSFDTIRYTGKRLIYEFSSTANISDVYIRLHQTSLITDQDTAISLRIHPQSAIPINLQALPVNNQMYEISLEGDWVNRKLSLTGWSTITEPEDVKEVFQQDEVNQRFIGEKPKPDSLMKRLFKRELVVSLSMGDGDTIHQTLSRKDSLQPWLRVQHVYEEVGEYQIQALIEQRWKDRRTDSVLSIIQELKAETIIVEVDELELKQVPIPEIELVQEDLSDLLLPIQRDNTPFYLTLGLLLVYVLGELLWLRLGHKPIIDTAESLTLPEWKPLKIDRPQVHLFRSRLFGQVSLMLRQRRSIASEELDVPASLSATLRKGGLPALAWRPDQQTAQYLFLIERYGREDHLAFYWKEMVAEFQQRDISVEYFYFHPDQPDVYYRTWEEAHIQYDLGQLASVYANYRLLVVGEGSGFLRIRDGRIKEEAEGFLAWRERAWMSTRPLEKWGSLEYGLSQKFMVLPAHEEGLSYLIPQWTGEKEPIPFYVWPTIKQLDQLIAPPEEDDEPLLTALQEYLGKAGFEWLCCCAKYPELYWELTLQYGEMLGILEAGSVAKHNPILLRLIRLSWFRAGDMPKHIRLLLYDQLSEERRGAVRKILINILEATQHNERDDHSLAHARQQGLLAVYRFEDSARSKKDEEELKRKLGAHHPARLKDAITLKSLREIKRNPLALILPPSFYKYGIRFFGTKWWVRPAFALMGMVLIVGMYVWWNADEVFVQEWQEPFKAESLQLATARDTARFLNYMGEWLARNNGDIHGGVEADSTSILDSIVGGDNNLSYFEAAVRKDKTYKEAAFNRAAYSLMRGKKMYESGLYEDAVKALAYCCRDTLESESLYMLGLADMMNDSLGNGLRELIQVGASYYDTTDSYSFFKEAQPASRAALLENLTEVQGQYGHLKGKTDTLFAFLGKKILDANERSDSIALNDSTAQEDGPDFRDIPMDSSDISAIYLTGYIGWQYEKRIPVVGANVSMLDNTTLTDSSGHFRLRFFPQPTKDEFTLTVTKDSFDPYNQAFTFNYLLDEANLLAAYPDSVISLDTIQLAFAAKPTPTAFVQGGVFMMGKEEDSPGFPVRVDDFEMDKYEVTVAQYMTFVQETGGNEPDWLDRESRYYLFDPNSANEFVYYQDLGAALIAPNHPITGVSWNNAVAYANWLSEQTGYIYDLPSEAEWEYAARGGELGSRTGYIYAGSNDISEVAWYNENSNGSTHPVGSKKPISPDLDIYDMSGNIYEWCKDGFGEYPDISETAEPIYPFTGTENGAYRGIRGGSWGDVATVCRVASRVSYDPSSRSIFVGFRLRRIP